MSLTGSDAPRIETRIPITTDKIIHYLEVMAKNPKFHINVSDFGLANIRRRSCNHTLSRTGPSETRLKLYTLFRAEGPKTIPYRAARPSIAHGRRCYGEKSDTIFYEPDRGPDRQKKQTGHFLPS